MTFNVPAPITMYDAVHSAIKDVTGGGDQGMLVHIGRETDVGFEIVEIWESRDAYDKFLAETWPRVVAKLGAGDMGGPQAEEFDIRGLIISARTEVYV